jgi:MoaA/NifB/PqqE/SkfB family radical SAM enzyme
MEVRVLDAVPFPIDMDSLAKQLRIREGSGHLEKLEKLADQARAVGKPKVVFRAAYIEERSEDRVRVNGVLLSSRVLRVNLDKAHRVFPYVATCGAELEEWSQGVTDLLEKFWADAIKEMAVKQTVRYLNEYLTESFQPGRLSRMNPGSLPDWPLSEQRPLFNILEDGPRAIGVRLTDHFLMMPIKSVSGIWFPTEESFESCKLCPREKCPGRRAAYDRDLYTRKYAKKT